MRGIAATALTKLLMDHGHVIVQASRVIQERFGLPLNTAPADVTVKDGDLDELVVIGFPKEAGEVLNDIVSELEYVFVWKPKLNLHSVVVARVVDRKSDVCVLELPNGLTGELGNCNREKGDLVTVSIVRPPIKPWEKPRLSTSLRVIGEYVAVIYGSPRLTVSEHVRDSVKRRELLAAVTAAVMGKGVGVHLRSSCSYASVDDVVREIGFLEERLRDVVEKARGSSEPCIVYDGELVAILSLSSIAKEKLDFIRSCVVPTITRHHSLKAYGGSLSDIVDYIEVGLEMGFNSSIAYSSLQEYILSKLVSRPRVDIVHVKPDGRVLKLTPGRVELISRKPSGGYIIRLKRTLQSPGLLDGLGVEKRPGDYDEMVVETDQWFIHHNYYRSNGEPLGVYININTPPEIYPDQIKYHDLAVDIVYRHGEEPKIIDMDELEKLYREGIVTEQLYKKTIEEVEKIYKQLNKDKNRINSNNKKPNTHLEKTCTSAGVPEPGQRGRA